MIEARFRFRICLPELLRARRFLYVDDFYWRKNFQIGQDCRSLPLLAEREALPPFHPTVPAVGLRSRTVRVSGRLYEAVPANSIQTEGSQNTSGIHTAAVPNGSVRRVVGASCISFASAPVRKLTHSAALPLQRATASLGCKLGHKTATGTQFPMRY